MDRYLIRCVCQNIVPITKQEFPSSRRGDFSPGLPRFLHDKGEVMDPTDDQMEVFNAKRKVTIEEAWRRFHSEKLLVSFALQMFAHWAAREIASR